MPVVSFTCPDWRDVEAVDDGIHMYALAVPSKVHNKVDREQDGLVGPVQAVARESRRIGRIPWLLITQKRVLSVTTYDVSGNRTERINYESNDGASEKEVYIYDMSGRKTESILRQASTTTRKTYCYDDAKKTIETREQVTSNRETINRKYVSVLDDSGNQIEASYSDDSGLNIKAFYRYAHDDKGKVTTIETCNESSSRYHEVLFDYDADGRLTIQAFYGPNGIYEKRLFDYGANETTEERLIYKDDAKVHYKTLYRYDDRENLVETTGYAANALVGRTSYSFKYDGFGNWVQKVTKSLNPVTNKPTSSWAEYQRISYFCSFDNEAVCLVV
jgi:hypothetical protein